MLTPPPVQAQCPEVITPWSACSIGSMIQAHALTAATANWPTANMAFFFPFALLHRRTFTKALWNCGTVSGPQSNIDVGVYDLAGTRLGSLGSTAQGASNTTNVATFGAAITLDPGRYLLAMACDGTDGFARVTTTAVSGRCAGMFQVATAFVLPSSVTLAANSNGYVPLFGIGERSTL